jgi:hypothetical protein
MVSVLNIIDIFTIVFNLKFGNLANDINVFDKIRDKQRMRALEATEWTARKQIFFQFK